MFYRLMMGRYLSHRKARGRTGCVSFWFIGVAITIVIYTYHLHLLLDWHSWPSEDGTSRDGPDAMKMGLKPEVYDKMNTFQEENANETIVDILSLGTRRIQLIVDIGCGTGDVTAMLAKSIPDSKILAFDIDPLMIDFARNHNNNQVQKKGPFPTKGTPNIAFFVEDVSQSWKKLSAKLRREDGNVDLIFSNFVLHWIPVERRQLALSNVIRLLKESGKFYFNIELAQPILELMAPEDQAMFVSVLKIPSFQDQEKIWRHYLEVLNVTIVTSAILARKLPLKLDQQVPFTTEYLRMYRPYLEPSLPREAKDEILRDIHTSLGSIYLSKESEETGAVSVTYYVLRIYGFK